MKPGSKVWCKRAEVPGAPDGGDGLRWRGRWRGTRRGGASNTRRGARAARWLVALAALVFAVAASAMPAAIRLGHQQLAAASCTVRSTLWIEHYAVVLYLPGKGAPADDLIDPTKSKALRMRIINRLLMPNDIPPKWREPMEANLDPAEFDRANRIYRDLQPGDRLTIAYAPDSGVVVSVNGNRMATARGHRLVDALLATWADGKPLRAKLARSIGRHPCDSEALAEVSGRDAEASGKASADGRVAGGERGGRRQTLAAPPG